MRKTTDLLHRDALAIVASCKKLLRSCGHVVLSQRSLVAHSDRNEPRWLEVFVSKEMAMSVDGTNFADCRDAVQVLRAVASCPGYAPQLNPHVWEEILLSAGVELGEDTGQGFDDAFPRVRIIFESWIDLQDAWIWEDPNSAEREAEQVNAALRGFAGLDGMKMRNSEYKSAMARLKKCTTMATPLSPPLELALALPSMDTQWLLPTIAGFTRDLRKSTTRSTVTIVEISINQSRFVPEQPMDALRWLEEVPHIDSISKWILDKPVADEQTYVALYRRLLGVDGVNKIKKVSTLEVVPWNLNSAQFMALCSALPFTRTVRRLHIRWNPEWEWAVLSSKTDWAWLCYAIFHIRTPSSTWLQLEIEGMNVSEEHLRVCEALRKNGIVSLDSRRSDDASGDCSAYPVRPRTRVWHKDDLDTLAKPLIILEDTACLDGIGVPVDNNRATATFQKVLVPGCGFAYVDTKDVDYSSMWSSIRPHDWTFLGLSTPMSLLTRGVSLKTLKLSQGDRRQDPQVGLLSLVHALGSSLTCLELVTALPLTAQEVGKALSACPDLTALAIIHDGTAWKNWNAASTVAYPRLKSVFQTCSLVEAVETVSALSSKLKAVFPAVENVAFRLTTGKSAFPSVAVELGGLLLVNETITGLTLVKSGDTSRPMPITRSLRERRTKRLSRLGLPSVYIDAPTQRENSQYARSVRVGLQPLWKALGTSLPVDIIDNILAFAGGVRKRHLWFQMM